MPNIHILCIEDEADVRDAILRDLAPFEDCFTLAGAGDAAEAQEYLNSLNAKDDRVGLIYCDHVMPGQRGIDLLAQLHKEASPVTVGARKVLFTGQAGHEDTIDAINRAAIDHYLPKPWIPEKLHSLTQRLLTDYVIESGIKPLPYMSVLDASRLAKAIHDRGLMNETG